MTLWIETICLLISLLVCWLFIYRGMYSRRHRLLPMIFAIVVVFGFYQIVKIKTGSYLTFHKLEDLLTMQVMYLLWAYVMDYHDIKMKLWPGVPAMLLLFSCDGLLFVLETDSFPYWITLTVGELAFFTIITITLIYAKKNFRYSEEEERVSKWLAMVLYVPFGFLVIQDINRVEHGAIDVVTIEIAMFLMGIMIIRGSIIDTRFFLNEQVFQEAAEPMLFFDHNYFLLGANDAACSIIPDFNPGTHMYVRDKRTQDTIKNFILENREKEQIELFGHTYRTEVKQLKYRDKVRGYIYTFYDETENIEAIQAAQNQTKMKAKFLARASHDLRSPLHAIIGVSEMLSGRREISHKNRHLIEQIHKSGNALLRIVNSILDYSKLEAGSLELSHDRYEISELIMELTQMNLVNLGDKQVDFSIRIDTFYPHILIGDRLRVSEMMQNILSNAVKFTEVGEIEGRISFHEKKGKMRMDFCVKDSGGGMSQEKLERMFEEYNSYASEQKAEGTGLGMTILKEFAHIMGGDVYASSDGKTGTTVGFFIDTDYDKEESVLPPEIFDAYRVAENSSNMLETVQPSFIYPEANVLLADDMEINRQIFERMTSNWQFKVDAVANGLQAVELVKNNHYDLIILDYMMPVMGGDEAVVQIKELTDSPVLLLSANVFDGNMDNFKELGFEEILSKPLDMKQIKLAIETFMPEELRHEAPIIEKKVQDERQLMGRKRAFESFRSELEKALVDLPELLETDEDNYRILAHGIKGAARQMEYDDLCCVAEVNEMAAQCHHTPFIHEHLDEFLDTISETIEDLRLEIESLDMHLEKYKKEHSAQVDTSVPKEDLLSALVSAIEDFDSVEAERLLNNLEQYDLSDEEKGAFHKIRQALNTFDYDEAEETVHSLV